MLLDYQSWATSMGKIWDRMLRACKLSTVLARVSMLKVVTLLSSIIVAAWIVLVLASFKALFAGIDSATASAFSVGIL